MFYVNFLYKSNPNSRYCIKCDDIKDAYHIADCLRYCDHIKNIESDGHRVLFAHIKITENFMGKNSLATGNYKQSIIRWVERGSI